MAPRGRVERAHDLRAQSAYAPRCPQCGGARAMVAAMTARDGKQASAPQSARGTRSSQADAFRRQPRRSAEGGADAVRGAACGEHGAEITGQSDDGTAREVNNRRALAAWRGGGSMSAVATATARATHEDVILAGHRCWPAADGRAPVLARFGISTLLPAACLLRPLRQLVGMVPARANQKARSRAPRHWTARGFSHSGHGGQGSYAACGGARPLWAALRRGRRARGSSLNFCRMIFSSDGPVVPNNRHSTHTK